MNQGELIELLPPMITIPGGPFMMGTRDDERSALAKRYGGTRESYAEESPQHEVVVGPFAIAQVLVTNALYASFQKATAAHMPVTWAGTFPSALAQHPVVDVSWNEAQSLCAWLQQATGRPWRLPTEAEWEKAARGTDGRAFPWGNTFDAQRCNAKESGLGQTTAVNAYDSGASPYGVLDLAGNVWEWTQSLQSAYPYNADDGRNGNEARVSRPVPRFLQRLLRNEPEHALPTIETRRIIRGGCYANPEGFARSACRLRLSPERRTPFLGIRLALDVEQKR
jgi:formylglycine-generating enzyme required for sulfatase activity